MAVTATLLTSAAGATNITSIVSASITVTAGRPVLLAVFISSANGALANPTVTGAGQTWTKVTENTTDDFYDCWAIYSTPATSGGSGAVTMSLADSTDAWAYAIIEFNPGSDTVAIGSPQTSTWQQDTATPSSTITSAGTGNYNFTFAMAGQQSGNRAGVTATPRSGWTEVVDIIGADSGWCAAVHGQISPVNGDTTASVTFSDTMDTRLVTFPLTVTAGGGQTITAPLLSSTNFFGAVTVTKGNLNVTAPLLTVADFFGAVTVNKTLNVTAPLLQEADFFGSVTVTKGNLNVAAPLLSSVNYFGAHTVTNPGVGGQSVTVPLLQSANFFGSVTVTKGNLNVSAPLLQEADFFGGVTVQLTRSVIAPFLQSTNFFGPVNVTLGAASIAAPILQSVNFFGPVTILGGVQPVRAAPRITITGRPASANIGGAPGQARVTGQPAQYSITGKAYRNG